MGQPLRIGLIGVGKISEQYFASFARLPGLELVAVADLDAERAAAVAAKQGVPALAVGELLASPNVDAILNLTIPAAHIDIDERAIAAGKHVYSEKPLALAPADARGLLVVAEGLGLRIGCAPDTVLGTGVQTARQLLDSGAIGVPTGASAFLGSPGHELWHPAPDFYYQAGGGPLFDMGPYYLTTLVNLLGPVVRINGSTGRSDRSRTVATGPLAGHDIQIDVDTHVTALLEHESGVVSTVTMSFEIWATKTPPIEVFGTEGTIAVPDPNTFAGAVELYTAADPSWRTVAPSAGYADAGRGYGLADMAHAIATGRPHRASADLAFHVLEIMDAIVRAGHDHAVIELASTVERPEPVPSGAVPSKW